MVHLIEKHVFNFVEQILRHEEILDFARIKFRDLDPNLHFCGYEILRGKKQKSFFNHEKMTIVCFACLFLLILFSYFFHLRVLMKGIHHMKKYSFYFTSIF